MTPSGLSPRSPSPSAFFAGEMPAPIVDDLDDMLLDALRSLPAPASLAEIGAWLEANYNGFDHEAHGFDLLRRLRANVERDLIRMERRYRLRATPHRNCSSSTDPSDDEGERCARRRRRTAPEMTTGEPESLSELYSSDISMEDDYRNDDSATPS